MVQVLNIAIALVATASTIQAAPIEKRQSGCSSYIIIDTRGTGEIQGPSAGFRTMNKNIQSKMPGGSVYNTVYSAGFTQISTAGTNDIVKKVTSTLSSAPDTCFVLEGYSQGAAATTNALSKLDGTAFDAVKAVFLIGNPEHRKGKACNVDTSGGDSTANVNGLSATLGGIPDNWVPKTLDVCNKGDGVCDTTHGFGINAQHLAYPGSSSTQTMGTEFVVKMLSGASSSGGASTGASGTASGTATDSSSAGTASGGVSTLGADSSSTGTESSGTGTASGGLSSLGTGSSSTGTDSSSSGTTSGGLGGLSGLKGLGGGSSALSSFKSPFSGLMGGSGSSGLGKLGSIMKW